METSSLYICEVQTKHKIFTFLIKVLPKLLYEKSTSQHYSAANATELPTLILNSSTEQANCTLKAFKRNAVRPDHHENDSFMRLRWDFNLLSKL